MENKCGQCLPTEEESRALAIKYNLPWYFVKPGIAHQQRMVAGDAYTATPTGIKLWHALVVADGKACAALAETV